MPVNLFDETDETKYLLPHHQYRRWPVNSPCELTDLKSEEEKNGGQGRNRTGVDGFAGRSITTLPPGLGEEFLSIYPEARYSTIALGQIAMC